MLVAYQALIFKGYLPRSLSKMNGTIINSDDYVMPLLQGEFTRIHRNVNNKAVCKALLPHVTLPSSEVKVVSISGGAGSGKSYLSNALVKYLTTHGYRADTISTDDYNRGDRQWRRHHFEGNVARNPLDKWDFELMNKKIASIRANRDVKVKIRVPTYSSETGLAIDEGEENYQHKIGPLDVLIVEGDIYAVDNPDLSIFVHMADQKRLQNRIQRDVEGRNEGSEEVVIQSFTLRQKNQHFPYSLPAIDHADIVLDVSIHRNEWIYDVYQRKRQ